MEVVRAEEKAEVGMVADCWAAQVDTVAKAVERVVEKVAAAMVGVTAVPAAVTVAAVLVVAVTAAVVLVAAMAVVGMEAGMAGEATEVGMAAAVAAAATAAVDWVAEATVVEARGEASVVAMEAVETAAATVVAWALAMVEAMEAVTAAAMVVVMGEGAMAEEAAVPVVCVEVVKEQVTTVVDLEVLVGMGWAMAAVMAVVLMEGGLVETAGVGWEVALLVGASSRQQGTDQQAVQVAVEAMLEEETAGKVAHTVAVPLEMEGEGKDILCASRGGHPRDPGHRAQSSRCTAR